MPPTIGDDQIDSTAAKIGRSMKKWEKRMEVSCPEEAVGAAMGAAEGIAFKVPAR